MTKYATRRSAVQDILAGELGAKWPVGGRPGLPVGFSGAAAGEEVFPALGMTDLSVLPRFGIKGRRAKQWLHDHGVQPTELNYGVASLTEPEALVVRLGVDEFLLEGNGSKSAVVEELDHALGFGADGAYRVERQDSVFGLSGSRATAVLEEVCPYNFREQPTGVVLTRMAGGVSAMVWCHQSAGVATYRIWADCAFGSYLWRTLHEIVLEHGGDVVGATLFFDSSTGRIHHT